MNSEQTNQELIDFPVEVKPAEESQIDFLEQAFSPGDKSRYHHQRFEKQQKGEAVYLIAWHDGVPVGHFVLNWSGPTEESVTKFLTINQRAYLEAGGTREEFRKKGVATKLIAEAEKLAKEHGCTKIGMEVGESDNRNARKLYEKLGYKVWDHGEFTTSWEYVDKAGNKGTESEVVVYLDKNL